MKFLSRGRQVMALLPTACFCELSYVGAQPCSFTDVQSCLLSHFAADSTQGSRQQGLHGPQSQHRSLSRSSQGEFAASYDSIGI